MDRCVSLCGGEWFGVGMATNAVQLTLNITARYQAWPYLATKMATSLGFPW